MKRLALGMLIFLCGCASQQPPLDLFPDATEVHVFGGVDFTKWAAGGTVAGKRLENGVYRDDVPATDGGALSADEIALLRRSIRIDAEPHAMAMCCTPRHAFMFHDGRHRAIGYLDVCFECGCAHVYPPPGSLASFSLLNWDREALTRIVEAHHLPPLPKKD
jgi:hypothetical protein